MAKLQRAAKPHYTQIPDVFFDEWLRVLTPSETKVLCVVMRKTFGWRKDRDRIPLSILQSMTGMARTTVVEAANGLEGRGLVEKRIVRGITEYTILLSVDPPDVGGEIEAEEASSEMLPGTEAVGSEELPEESSIPTATGSAAGHSIDRQTPTTDKERARVRTPKDEVRAYAEKVFREETMLEPPGREAEAGELWWWPLRQICDLVDWQKQGVEWLIKTSLMEAEKSGWMVSSPKSILSAARAAAAKRKRSAGGKTWQNRGKDLKGQVERFRKQTGGG